ncbi:hypothetical protein B0I00_1038 [Novosphingobium kunmingense]|uniref:Uncharacterized protein n=1 Tax=Novosphingobium kunmingense TaxID=1211806 RepID=A0A2N0I3T3_9SPHN|nr:hypothetical protein [Novosphingobium kunmingense]PKB25831.1 hypothetical protein B0I00_1038 [Novosphingobium kunmingense]
MKTLSKALVGTIAAGAVAISSATPAMAQSYRDRDGISAGDVIAGALVIGGIAAVASAASRGNSYGYDRDYRDDRDDRYGDYRYGGNRYGYGYGGNPRQAIEQCVYAAERTAGRYSYGRADVTDIRDVKQTRYGLEVKGRIAVNQMGRGWRSGDNNYGRGWGNDYRGWNQNLRGYDAGSFKCRYERGRVVDIDFSGIRGL